MQPSWRLLRAPIRIECTSPRSTEPYQRLESAPISTSPTTTAPGAIQASGWMRGQTPA
jgi:hypothetical protein